jgi:hypothetical protein
VVGFRGIPRHPWVVVLRQVHGGPELHLPQDEDAGAKRCHYRGFFDRARVRLRSAWSTPKC